MVRGLFLLWSPQLSVPNWSFLRPGSLLDQEDLGLTAVTRQRKAGRQLLSVSSKCLVAWDPCGSAPGKEGPSWAISALQLDLGSEHSHPGQEKVPTPTVLLWVNHFQAGAATSHPVPRPNYCRKCLQP